MPVWLLVLVGLCIPRYTLTVNDKIYDLGLILRIAIFICCCIWG